MQEIFRIAARASSMSAVAEVLQTIAERTGSYGCILWRVAPSAPSEGDRYLFAAAEWFPDARFSANHALPFSGSATGSVIQTCIEATLTIEREIPECGM
ncbi:MAG: hypothetical protein JWO56_1738 [Acidobacteria bacterium]|nr:hypothetical protein [Acidobacteriota bacterium]